VAHCPSCLKIYDLAEFREHMLPCLTAKLEQYKTTGQRLQVRPMDATQYLDFSVSEVRDEIVVLHKFSNMQNVDIPLRSIREITPPVNDEVALLSLRGRLRWDEGRMRWKFNPD
jgi:hypothetical protein